jgi:hypothetical protein
MRSSASRPALAIAATSAAVLPVVAVLPVDNLGDIKVELRAPFAAAAAAAAVGVGSVTSVPPELELCMQRYTSL